MYINKNVTPEIAKRQRIERAIVRRVVKDALAAGYRLDVDDGGDELAVEGATALKPVMDALMNTDEDRLWLRLYDAATGRVVKCGWVQFVYGNDGWDVISDHSVSVDGLMEGAMKLAGRLEAARG